MKAVDFPVVQQLRQVVQARMAFFNAMMAAKNDTVAAKRPQKVEPKA